MVIHPVDFDSQLLGTLLIAENSLIEENFAVLFATPNCLSQPHTTQRMGLWTLKETTIAADSVIHAILCRSMKFYGEVSTWTEASEKITYPQRQRQLDYRV